MPPAFTFAVTGVGIGAIFAVLAMGLIITYKGTGVINFAAGAMGMWSGYVFSELRTTGDYVFPVVFLPDRVHLADDMPVAVAVAVAVVTGVLLGLVVHVLVFRPLRSAPTLAKVVASAGLMLALQALIVMRFGAQSRTVEGVLPAEPVRIGDVGVLRDRLWLAGLVLVAAVLVAQWFKRTRTGLAIQAASENQRFADLAGYSPDRLAATAWAMSSGLIGFVVVLGAPITGLNPVSYTLLIVPALACALVGRLQRIGPAVAAGFAVGVVQSEASFYSTQDWWPDWASVDVASVVPFVAVIVVLFSIGRSLPARDAETSDQLPVPTMPRHDWRWIAVFVGAGLVLLAVTGGSYRFGILTSLTMSVIALSFVVLTGLLGQVSFAQAAFAGIAGFTLAKLTTELGWGFPWAPLLAALGAGLCGLLAGIPALRIRGAQLAVVTLALSLALDRVLFTNTSFNDLDGNRVVQPQLFGIDLAVRKGDDTARFAFGALVLVIAVLLALAVGNWIRSGTGRRFVAVRSNERASASLGIDVTATKLLGFVVAAFLAGIGGTLIGYGRGSISAESFTTLVGVSFLVYAYLGGIASVSGAFVAGLFAPLGIVYVVVNRQIPAASDQGYQLLSAVALIVTAIHNPEGIAGGTRAKLDALVARGRRRRADGAAASASDAPEADVMAVVAVSAVAPPATASLVLDPRPAAPLLVIDGLGVRFGGLRAVDDVSLEVRAGQIVGLMGANGAGKTTLIDAASGFVPYTGEVLLDGRPLDHLAAHRRARAGLVRSWQSVELIHELTVRDNLQLAAERASVRTALRDVVAPLRRDHADRVDVALQTLGIEHLAERRPGELSLGEQKLINVARSLAASPRVLLLDEPAAGLSSRDTAALGQRLRSVVAGDLGALLIEHDVGLMLDLCDHIYVLDFGRLIAHGMPEEIRDDQSVVAAYLGIDERRVAPGTEPKPEPVETLR